MTTISLAEAFNPRSNSIGFLRWFMAFLVIFSHAGPLGGFYGGHDLGVQWSSEQSFGGVAVAGFFFLSGFLITKSQMATKSTARYLWKRVLRIYPAWLATLLVVAFVFGPIAWIRETGSLGGYFTATFESPFTYFSNNMWLPLEQHGIAGMGTSLPFYEIHGGFEWNGSAWTLAFEFTCYLAVALLGLMGALVNRHIGGAIAAFVILLSTMQWLQLDNFFTSFWMFHDFRMLLLFAPFAWGMLFSLYGDKIPINDIAAIVALGLAILTYGKGGWLVFGQYAFLYFLMWFAIRVQFLRNWEKFGDFSYGIYIIGWPMMQLAGYFGLQNYGWWVYHIVVIVLCHVYAFLSWHLLEKPAMSLKNWTPRWLQPLQKRWGPPLASLRERAQLKLPAASSNGGASHG